MCSVSAVMDYGRQQWWPDLTRSAPNPWPNSYQPPYQPLAPVPTQVPAADLKAFLKLVEAAKAFDKQTGQPDCEDPVKAEVLERILQRLDAIEQQLSDPTR